MSDFFWSDWPTRAEREEHDADCRANGMDQYCGEPFSVMRHGPGNKHDWKGDVVGYVGKSFEYEIEEAI